MGVSSIWGWLWEADRMVMTRTAAGHQQRVLCSQHLAGPNPKGLVFSYWHSCLFPTAPQQLAECGPGPSYSPA